ncbi:MAG: hypothetical protein QOK21_1083 [Solirubrobacteraceae bacterium]|jgi:hypothetical protein|nr:hypothetical protein [Solirubrobacteraceae bacterium]
MRADTGAITFEHLLLNVLRIPAAHELARHGV